MDLTSTRRTQEQPRNVRYCSPMSDQQWTRYTTSGTPGQQRPVDQVELGPGNVAGLDRKLLGELEGLRVLELGTGAGHSAIALAAAGARVVGIDPDADQIMQARAAVEDHEVHVELHNSDFAELAFLRADSFDLVLSVHALAATADLARVFRQVHRVLKADKPFVLTLPHPATLMVDNATGYFDTQASGTGHHLTHHHTVSSVFTSLTRSNYRVDTLLEPDDNATTPASLVMRARKLGA